MAFDIGQVVQAVETAQQGGLAAAGWSEKHRDGVGWDIQLISRRDSVPSEYCRLRFSMMILLFIYSLSPLPLGPGPRADAVAIMFMPSTKTSSTSAVPYWIWKGISGTWVEITNR